jgi:hypothetical protein
VQRTCPVLLVLAALALLAPAPGKGAEHELVVRLEPDEHRLVGTDEIAVSDPGPRIRLTLSPDAEIQRVTVNGQPAEHRVDRGSVVVSIPSGCREGPVTLRVEYAARFDDPVPRAPANIDNPGFGVTGIVGREGTFLLGGAGWYPARPGDSDRFSITVDAPEGIKAVTAGRCAGHRTEGGRTLSFWEVERAPGKLALAAGPYTASREEVRGIQTATYFTPETQHLADRYLAAVKRYLRMYSDLFGPYPFAKFAVVENFFPTGYGFPSYTLIGGRVLRLPFIVETSLGHEIAHCWWGNGVLVDETSGNWSEGLTTYVADHRYRELESAEAARRYRKQWLRNYAALVDETDGLPLSEFTRRTNRVTKVVGYEKGAMVFHMLRRLVGDAAFWNALRDVYRDRLFERASWKDFRIAFEARADLAPGRSLKHFFDQWVRREGAPLLALRNVARHRENGRWRVSGHVLQLQDRPFDLRVPLAIRTANGSSTRAVSVRGEETSFSATTRARPEKAELDPNADVFRRLHPEEIPASVNSIKGATTVTVVISHRAGRNGEETARMLVRALGVSGKARVIEESELSPETREAEALIFVGLPRDRSVLPPVRDPVAVRSDRFRVGERVFRRKGNTFFGVFDSARGNGRVVGLLYPAHPSLGPTVARKATHYGKYSYLAFRHGENVAKGIWPVTASPLIVRW